MFKRHSIYIFSLIILLAAFVRFFQLGKIPASLYYDEIDLSYQIKSLLSTGKDYRGISSPFYFRSFNTDKTPFPIYFSIIPSLLFKTPELQTRAGAALAGVIVVGLAMLIAYQITNKKTYAVAVGLVFAFSSWQIQFSRIAFEAIFMLMVYLASVSLLLYWLSSKKRWAFYLSAVLLGLNVYTYRTMSLFAPLTILLIVAIYHKEFLSEGWKNILIWLTLTGLMILPFLYFTTIGSADQPRINQISIFSDTRDPVLIQRAREVDSGDFANPEVGKKPAKTAFIFHNKVLSFIESFATNYYRNFSTEFLFQTGDGNIRHNPNNNGELLYLDLFGLIAGISLILKKIKNKNFQLIFFLLLLSPIPSDLTIDGATHASRLFIFSFPLLMTVGFGYAFLYELLPKKFTGKFIMIPSMIFLWLVLTVFCLHNYFVHFPIESAKEYGFGFKQAVEKIVYLRKNYPEVRLSQYNDPPMLYYLYWSQTQPIDLQRYGTKFDDKVIKHQDLDHIKPIVFDGSLVEPKQILQLKPDTIYMVTRAELPLDLRSPDKDPVPQGIKLLDVIKYPDNEVAFYLITRDVLNSKVVCPKNIVKCQ